MNRFTGIRKILSSRKDYIRTAENQRDIYYKVKRGRLKLRIINEKSCCLIYYRRNEKSGKRVSNYILSYSDNFRELDFILRQEFKILVTVVKKREIYIKNNIRIHLDTVKKLGKFLEVEIIYGDFNIAKDQMKEIISCLNLEETEFIKPSYSDLLINKK